MAAPTPDKMEPIAVVGLGCRFPGDATSPSALWDMMIRGESAWSEFPQDRVNIDSYFHPSGNRQGSICFRGAHFLKQNVAAFDNSFFSIPAEEAKAIDPQQRMLLEVAIEALDNAGIDRDPLRKGETGVWIGSFVKDYEQIVLRDPDNSPIYGATGNGIAIMANRISYFLDVNGPSMTIDTGCSASLVCVHNACQSLRDGEIDVGLAGGAGLILTPNTMMPMTALNFLSPDGKCYAFDARANGYGRGEGIGIVVLKRLSDAIRDNDTIRAVIRGSRVNQDGRTPGITLPSSEAQIRNIRAVYQRAGLETDQTAFVECHGTGTQAGDPRELRAVGEALCETRTAENPIFVGSLKTNIGHLEGCAGTAGMIKGILAVEHGIIPKHINFKAPGNPAIDFEGFKVKVPVDNTPWPVEGLRRASVNCFGFGGTNAHIIIDDAAHYLHERGLRAHHSTANQGDIPDATMPAASQSSNGNGVKSLCGYARRLDSHALPEQDFKSHLFVFSAHEQKALSNVLAKLSGYLAQTGKVDCPALLENLAYTLACRRTKLPWRTSLVAQSVEELIEKLQHMDPAKFIRTSEDKVNRLAFVFGGQGAQWFAMGRELMGFDVFLESLAKASQFLTEDLGSPFDLLAELLKDEQSSRINQPEVAQPATTAIQVALVDLLTLYYGVLPSSVIGHSSGEIAAAYAMGAITREGAWELAYQRGYCAAQLQSAVDKGNPHGQMLAVGLSASDAQSYIQRTDKGKVVVACINSPSSVTLSGDGDAILDVQKVLQDEKIFHRLLAVNVAYHSHHMMRCANDYLAAIKHIQPRHPVRGRVLHPHKRGGLVSHHDINLEPSSINESFLGSGNPVMYSSVTGEPIEWSALTPEYWTANMTSTVLFSDAMSKVIRGANGKRPNIVVEIGPHASLQGPIQQTVDAELESRHHPVYHSLLRRGSNAALTTLEMTGALWIQGVNVDMQWVVMRNLQSRRPKLLSDMPNYAWNHEGLHWHESHLSLANRFQVHGRYDLIGRPTADSVPFQPRWRGFFRVSENPWIEDHQVQKTLVYPAAGMVAMAIEGAKQLANGPCSGIEISQFKIDKAMIIPKTAHGLEYALNMSKKDVTTEQDLIGESNPSASTQAAPMTYEFFIYSKPLDAPWQQHGTGLATIHFENMTETQRHFDTYLDTRKSCNEMMIPRQLYETLDVVGMNYGPLFQNIAAISKRNQTCSYMLRIPDTKSVMSANFEFDHVIHPATLDSMFQTAFSLGGDSMVPSYIGSIYVSMSPKLSTEAGRELYGYAKAERQSSREAHATFVLSDESWNISDHEEVQHPLIYAKDVVFTALGVSLGSSGDEGFLPNHHNLCSELVWQPRDEPAGEFKKENDSSSTSEQEQAVAEIIGDTALLVPLGMSASLSTLCANLSRLLKCKTITLADVTERNVPDHCVSLLEIVPEQHFVWQWSQEDFEAFRTLLASAKGIVWVTRGSQAESTNPKASLIQALARTIHSENPQKRIVTLDMDIATNLADEEAARQILWVFSESFAATRTSSSTETEYAIRNGEIQVSRLVPLPSLNTIIENGSETSQHTPEQVVGGQGKETRLILGEIGQAGSLTWDADSGSSAAIDHHDVEVRVISAGIGPLDADIVFGGCRDQAMGTDVFGVVEALGEDVTGPTIGDHVLAVARGSLKDYVRCHCSLVHRVTDDEKDPALVVLPTYLTIADHALRTCAKLAKGHNILIHTGASRYGRAAIQLAQEMGAKVFATAANDGQRSVLRELYAVPEEHILNGNSGAFSEAIMRCTNGQGVDVLFDPELDYEKFNHQCMATDGHIICLKNGDSVPGPATGLAGKSTNCTMLDLQHLITKKPWILADSFHRVCSRGWNGWLPTMEPAVSYRRSQLSNAFSELKDSDGDGSPLFYLSSDSAGQTAALSNETQRVRNHLRPHGTYVISGQGGLGIQIAKLLVAHGVKHMALLSRSGARSKDSQEGIAFVEAQGAHVKVIKVDICDRAAMESAVEGIQRSMPPVRGLFQCAAAIHDSVFDNMTYETWQAAVRPKTVGSWNLYELFPRDMDFFIFLSSSAGVIGSRGQANYAAGNAFQDSLARHISTEGTMRAISIDLGPVLGAGMLADDPRTLDMLKASGFFGIRLQDFVVIVEHAILSCAAGDEMTLPPQIVLGVGTGGLIRQNKPADPYWTRTALFSRLNKVDMPPGSDVDMAGGGLVEDSVKHLLTKVGSAEEAQEVIKQGLMHVLAQSMNIKLDDVDDGKSPSAYGVDSLVAVGVRNWVFRECGVNVSVFEVLGDTSIAELSETIVHKGKLGSGQQ